MKNLFVLSFVAALSVAGCSKKKADTTPANTNMTEEKAADPCAGKTADPCAGTTTPADPCAGAADPCAGK